MALTAGHQPQFHHYIPRFILRNFSHKNTRSWDSTTDDKKHRVYRGDQALRTINLKDVPPRIAISSVKRTFGLSDMYMDAANAADRQYLERELSKLENDVSSILAEIRKASERGQAGFCMSRDQRDLLRKFLFIMKYRGPNFHERFHGDQTGNYKEDDKEQFTRYMQENGYSNPVDVWFKSIKTVLRLNMDLEGRWKQALLSAIYPDDAMWFIMHTEMYYLALCTPDNANDEFILTENSYNVNEGPNDVAFNPETSSYELGSWTSYHEFSPITPRLILVLRSCLLPNKEEDINESIKSLRREWYEANARLHLNSATAKSILEDLPIHKARNSYSQVSAEGIQLLPNEDGSRRSSHRFTFPFFKISTAQVHKINAIMLENAYLTSAIAFSSEASLTASLKYYLEIPADRGYKIVLGQDNSDVRLLYLRKLEIIAKSLGCAVNLVYKQAVVPDDIEEKKQEVLTQLLKDILRHVPEQPTEFMQLYNRLGEQQRPICIARHSPK
jgi:hypothetical protein